MRYVEAQEGKGRFKSVRYIAPVLVGGLVALSAAGCGDSTPDISKLVLDCSKPSMTAGLKDNNVSDNLIINQGQIVNLGGFPVGASSGRLGVQDSNRLVKPTDSDRRYTIKDSRGRDVSLVFEAPNKVVIHNPADKSTITAVGIPVPKGTASELTVLVNCG